MSDKQPSSSSIVVPALGRPFTLGSLYDKRSDTMLSGVKIWSRTQIADMIQRQPINSMTCGFETEKSLSSTLASLSSDGSMSLSVLCGIISASGSGRYLTQHSSGSDEESVSYILEVQSKFEELYLHDIKLNPSKLLGATHIVTGIQYGGTALFIFKRNRKETKSNTTNSGSFGAQIGSFLFASVSGSASRQVTVEEREEMEKVSVRYMGDFHLSSPPTTFLEAIKCIQNFKSADANAPMKVHLTPVSLLTADRHYHQEYVPLQNELQEKAADAYKLINKALDTLQEVIACLSTTLWTQVAKQLETNVQQLQTIKTSLDASVKDCLRNDLRLNSSPKFKLESTLSKFETQFPRQDLLMWLESVCEASKLLVEISHKLQEMGVQVITSQVEKTQFIMQNGFSELLMIKASCSAFSFQTNRTVRLLELSECERDFYSEIVRLGSYLKVRQISAATEQVEEQCAEDIQLMYEIRKNGEWQPWAI